MLKKIIIFMVAVFMLLMLAATPGVDAAGRKDVLVIGMATSDIISLDPAKAFEFSGFRSQYHPVENGLALLYFSAT